MGTWSASLYDDDQASDLKNTLAVLCKVPVDGDRLLEFLEEMHGDCDPADEDGALFWLVTADQFERRGIECMKVASMALSVIGSGAFLASAKDAGADEKFLKKRSLVLEELARRLAAPRPFKARKKPGKAPDIILQAGEVYAFPTMKGRAWHPYRLDSEGAFEPDAWGAMVVLATGRAFEWLPWCALVSLTVDPASKPSLDDATRGRLIPHPQTRGAGRFIPKQAHVRGLGLELLGCIPLDAALVEPQLSKSSVEMAIQLDWTISYAAFAPTAKGVAIGCELASLVKRAGKSAP